jgi:hypothetical protein
LGDQHWLLGPMRCHTGPESNKEGRQRCEPTISFGKHTRAAKHLAATCCTNATGNPQNGRVASTDHLAKQHRDSRQDPENEQHQR